MSLQYVRSVPQLAAAIARHAGTPYEAIGRWPHVVFRPVDFYAFDKPRVYLRITVPGEPRLVDEEGNDLTALVEAELGRMADQEELAHAS
jgi:hypothetical protein